MNTTKINVVKLKQALSKMLNKKIKTADYRTEQLQDGTVGDVKLISGVVETTDGDKLPYKIVLKIQEKWERHGDPESWRREYDLYRSGLDTVFTNALKWPECYHAEITENETQIWMEYIDGKSGSDLTVDMCEKAAEELGRFQGKLYSEQPEALKNITNLSIPDGMKNFYHHYRSWNVVYDYVRSKKCEFPKHIRKMITDMDEKSDLLWKNIETLPLVLCHRDFWITNIFYKKGKIYLIDWDTTGWGYLGEDITSLIADEADPEIMPELYSKCVPAYIKGFSEHNDTSNITSLCIYERIIMHYGYRLVEWYLHAESPKEKKLHLDTLQAIYEMNLYG